MDKKERQKQKLREVTRQESQREKETLVIDFDKAIAESKSKSIVIKWDGDEYLVPAEPPQWFVNLLYREDFKVSDPENEEILERLFGKEFVDSLYNGEDSNWIGMKMANEHLIMPIMKQWGFGPVKDTTKKK